MKIRKEYANYQDGGLNSSPMNIKNMSVEELQDLLRTLQNKQESNQIDSNMPSQRDIEMRARSEGRIPQGTPMEVSGQVIDTPIGPMHHGPTSSELHQKREEDESDRELQMRIHDVQKLLKNMQQEYQKGGKLPKFM